MVSHEIGLCRELLGYFGLFLIQFCKEGKFSVVKKLADFELPYVSLRSSEEANCKVGLRKWYLDPSLDSMLMDCRAAVDLIYMQNDFSVEAGVINQRKMDGISSAYSRKKDGFMESTLNCSFRNAFCPLLCHWLTLCVTRASHFILELQLHVPLLSNEVGQSAIQDIEKGWTKPTPAQRQKLEALQKEDNQTQNGSDFCHEIVICCKWSLPPPLEQFLELSRDVQHYGYVQLDPCTCDYLEPGCGAIVSVGNNEISCCITLPDNQTQDVIFQMNRVKSWQITFLGTLLDMDGPQRTLNQNLELRVQYSKDSRSQWFVIYTKQAFLLSSCLKKMISEKMVKLVAENPEMQIEVPEQAKSKKYHIQQSQKDYSSFLPRKSKIKVEKVDCVFGTIKEEDL
ncbi:sorting nexin-31 isoform X1 [Equus quagga]|uniref:sorting nexin-31 isoform X1 n=1 Tax=Equus quagga TaxID=89248 RepID=UPI001EE39EFD|nr:sorting nexin-31 isoform X1 [Equus quagga]